MKISQKLQGKIAYGVRKLQAIKDTRKLFKIGRFSNESFNSYVDCLTSKGAMPEKCKQMNKNASGESPSVAQSMIPTYVASHEPSKMPSNAPSNRQSLPPTYMPSLFPTIILIIIIVTSCP